MTRNRNVFSEAVVSGLRLVPRIGGTDELRNGELRYDASAPFLRQIASIRALTAQWQIEPAVATASLRRSSG
jgi:hypothetical protein